MKTLYFDGTGGASGDMLLGVFADLGLPMNELEADLAGLHIGPFRIVPEQAVDHGLRGVRVTVHVPPPSHEHHHGQTLADIEQRIRAAGLPEPVCEQSIRVFRRIAEAEARAHGLALDAVHFHEVGAADSLVDIVGSCLALHRLGIDGVAVAPLPMGVGSVDCDHGVYPSPAPATVELLKGFPIEQTDEPVELVTPTGAGLLTEWKNLDSIPVGARARAVGHGLGHHPLRRRPNLLRATLFETDSADAAADHCLILECNLDDSTPELIGSLTQRLLEAGALDVFVTPVQMKKQRPGSLLTVLCEPGHREALLDLLFRESTTFGVREYLTRRTLLDRRLVDVPTPHGTLPVKIGSWKGVDVTWAPEMEDCIRLARQRQLSVREIYETAKDAARQFRQEERIP